MEDSEVNVEVCVAEGVWEEYPRGKYVAARGVDRRSCGGVSLQEGAKSGLGGLEKDWEKRKRS